MQLPLQGLRVLEIAQNLAGPYTCAILAALGAEVVKIERPAGGDDARAWGPPFVDGDALAFHAVNCDKRSVALDLARPEAVQWVREYAAGCDVLVENLRPGALEKLGLGAADLTSRHPRLIYCSLRAFGAMGPMRSLPGFEPMVQAFSGLFSVNGAANAPPTRMGTQVLDHGSAMWAVIGILAALQRRHATGRGGVVDASLFETALGWLLIHHAGYGVSGELPVRDRAGSPKLVIFQAFEASDGEVIVTAANDRLFVKFVTALGHPEWGADPRFRTNADRVANRAALIPGIEQEMRKRTRAQWIATMEAAGVPCAPIHDLPEVLAHPQTAATGMVEGVPGLDLRLMALPLSFDGERPRRRRRAPKLGEHNAELPGLPTSGSRPARG